MKNVFTFLLEVMCFAPILMILECCNGGNEDHSDSETESDGWELMPSGVDADLMAIWGTSSSDVFVVGAEGVILHYNGAEWTSMESGTTHTLQDVWGASSDAVWAVGGNWSDRGIVLHYNGEAWTEALNVPADESVRAVWGTSVDNVYALGEDGETVAYQFDGTEWSLISGENVPTGGTGIWGSSETEVFVSAYDGIWQFNGIEWSSQFEYPEICFGIWGASSTTIFAACNTNPLFQFDGSTWSSSSFGEDIFGAEGPGETYYSFADMVEFSDSDIWAISNFNENGEWSSHVFHYDGNVWSEKAIPELGSISLGAIWGPSPNELFVVGSAGTIYHRVSE